MIEPEKLLLKEIEIVHREIARYDNNGLTVKGWCLTVWAGLIAYGVQNSEPFIVAAALVTTISFSLVELTYRRYQLRFISRSERIEQMLSFENQGEYKFDIHFSAIGKRDPSRLRDELPKVLILPHFSIFYLILAVFAYGAYLYVLYVHAA
jgi:hypothetical protein